MDLSELYNAILIDDQYKIDRILGHATSALIKYLKINMQATDADAKDSVQQALLLTYEKIKSNKIRDPSKLYYYLLTAAKNIYLRMSKRNNLAFDESNPYHASNPATQLNILIDKEKQKLLSVCLEELNDSNRDFIEYLFKKPKTDAKTIARHFNITVNSAWTRKHRIIKMLGDCVEKKINL